MNLEILIRQLVLTINNTIDNNIIDRDTVKQIVVGVSKDWHSILVWATEEWEEYKEFDEHEAIGRISNVEWLDSLDNLFKSDTDDNINEFDSVNKNKLPESVEFLDPRLNNLFYKHILELQQTIVAAIRRIAISQDLGSFTNTVGFMAQGITRSENVNLIAFYHPEGAGVLLPIKETIKRRKRSTQYGVLSDKGITMFYPEDDSLTKSYLFSDMLMYYKDRHDILFKMKDDPSDIRLAGSTSYDEWINLKKDAILEILINHFRTHPELELDPETMPDPSDEKNFSHWFEIHKTIDMPSVWRIIREGLNSYGTLAANTYLEYLSKHDIMEQEVKRELAEYHLKKGEPGEALKQIEALKEKTRSKMWELELRSLMYEKKYEEFFDYGNTRLSEDEKNRDKINLYMAMAWVFSGESGRAEELITSIDKDQDGFYWWVKALVLYSTNKTLSIQSLHRALSEEYGTPLEFAEFDFKEYPELLSIIKQKEVYTEQYKKQGAYIREHIESITPVILKLHTENSRESVTWKKITACNIKKDHSFEKIAYMERHKICLLGSNVGLVEFDYTDPFNPISNKKLECNFKLYDCSVEEKYYLVAQPGGLTVINPDAKDSSESEISAQRYFNDRLIAIAFDRDSEIATLTGNHGSELYDISDLKNPQFLSLVGTGYPEMNYGGEDALIDGSILYMAARWGGLITVDISNPKEPEILSAMNVKDIKFIAVKIQKCGDYLILTESVNGKGSWIINITDRKDPQSICLVQENREGKSRWVKLKHDENGSCHFLLIDEEAHMWHLEIDSNGSTNLIEVMSIIDSDVEEDEYNDELLLLLDLKDAALLSDGRIVVLEDKEIVILEKQGAPASKRWPQQEIELIEDDIVDWIDSQFSEYKKQYPEFLMGALTLSLYSELCRFTIEVPRSVVELNNYNNHQFLFEKNYSEITGSKKNIFWIGDEDGIRILNRVKDLPSFKNIMSGCVYLMHDSDDINTVVHIAEDESRPWVPCRPQD